MRRPASMPARLMRYLGLAAAVVITGVASPSAASAATCPCSIWSATATPATASVTDTRSVELGVKFRSDVAGRVTGIRFYKSAANTGTHTGSLWTRGGTRLASATFTGETTSGWQQVNFATPVSITASTTYVASYHAPVGRYAQDARYFATAGSDNPPLHALANNVDGVDGVFRAGSAIAFPSTGLQSSNFWVDAVFTDATGDITPPAVTATSPPANATGVSTGTSVSATFSEDVQPASPSLTLTGPSGQAVAGVVSYDSLTRTAKLVPSSPLADGTTYTAVVSGARDAAGNTMSAFTWSFTTALPPAACPCTLWPSSAVPGTVSTSDSSAVELGVRVRSDEPGYITGLRFYKGAGNTGTHIGHLWSNTGTLLASATFVSETSGGWQSVVLPAPVAIQANTTYVASYWDPNGFYSSDNDYFATNGVDANPLHAPRDGTAGANGVYLYGSSAFPTFTFRSSNYWVDVIFDRTATDTTGPTVTTRVPLPLSTSAPIGTGVIAGFSEPVQPATIAMSLSGPGGAVSGTTNYDSGTQAATFTPASSLAYATSYTVSVSGAKDLAGNTMNPVTWSFTTQAEPPPPPTSAPGGPVLLVTSGANPFTGYYAEILRAEGLNAFDAVATGSFSASSLSGHDVVVVGETSLSATQVAALTDFVNAGGSLIAMRPDPQLASLLGLTRGTGSLSDAYLAMNAASEPAAGIAPDTMQFHGPADRYTLSGASTVATLYSSATASTSNPAVTVRSVGANGGQAAAFTYDLARSVVLTRQGNAAWAGQERDGSPPVRSNDQFFGGSQTDWVNLTKVSIPQADEQQRLFANLIETMNRHRMPLPRFWYLPDARKAVIVGTGDDHGNGGTAGRFDQYLANSPAGCSVSDWTCLRFTSYVYTGTPLSNTNAAGYNSQGFEVGLHVSTGCADFTPASLESDFAGQLSDWALKYRSLPAPATNRTHCIPWSTWLGEPTAEAAHGIRLDTNYYYWPGSWLNDRPGFMTGSGLPMRFAATDGTMLDVYQAATQMTDESGQSYPFTPDTLLDNALGPKGYYGAFTANMHTDSATTSDDDGLIASAQAHGVPIISARQLLTWLDGRNGSSFKNLAWSNGTLSFSVSAVSGATGLTVLVPTASSAGTLTGITLAGSPVSFRTVTIKGLAYASFTAAAGTYAATYGTAVASAATTARPSALRASSTPAGATAPAPTYRGVTVDALPDGSATVTAVSDQPVHATVAVGASSPDLTMVREGSGRSTKPLVGLSRLRPSGTYAYRLTVRNAGGNAVTSPLLGFTVPRYGVADSRLAQFRMGTAAGVAYGNSGDGELGLARGASTGRFVSRLLDARQMVTWGRARWSSAVPGGAGLDVSVRTGSTARPGRAWTPWTAVANGGALGKRVTDSRYLQYRIRLSARGTGGPVLSSIGFTSSGVAPPVDREVPAG